MIFLAAFLLTISAVRCSPIYSRDCFEDIEIDCMENFVDAVFYSNGKVDECSELRKFIDCSTDAADECFGDERDAKVDRGLKELEKLSQDTCGAVSSGDNSDFDEETYSHFQLTATIKKKKKKTQHSTSDKKTRENSDSKRCFGERKKICWDTFENAVIHSVFYSSTGLDKCSVLRHYVLCTRKAADDCFGDENDEDADEVLEVWEDKSKQFCETDITDDEPVTVGNPPIRQDEKLGASRDKCQKPSPPENGAVECDEDLIPGNVCRFSCSDGYDLIGPHLRYCMPDYLMSGRGVLCYPVSNTVFDLHGDPIEDVFSDFDDDPIPDTVFDFAEDDIEDIFSGHVYEPMPDTSYDFPGASTRDRPDLRDHQKCMRKLKRDCILDLDGVRQGKLNECSKIAKDCGREAFVGCYGVEIDKEDLEIDDFYKFHVNYFERACESSLNRKYLHDFFRLMVPDEYLEQGEECLIKNKVHIFECIKEASHINIPDENTKICIRWDSLSTCTKHRIGEMCGEESRRKFLEQFPDVPESVKIACESVPPFTLPENFEPAAPLPEIIF